MRIKLKKVIIEWLCDNINQWQLINSCVEHFRAYIYDNNGNFLIGGEDVYNFIVEAEKLITKE